MTSPVLLYFPAIVRDEFDSPIDALVALCVPREEAMDRVTASWFEQRSAAWPDGSTPSLLTTVDGGRAVAVVYTEEGRWAACNAFPALVSATRGEAERRLLKLLKRGRRGCVGVMVSPAQSENL